MRVLFLVTCAFVVAYSGAIAQTAPVVAETYVSAAPVPDASETKIPATTIKSPASNHALEGKVTYYGKSFTGRKTANGERFDPAAMTMAHRTLPFGSMVQITNVKFKRSVIVRVNDRGPVAQDRIGDVSLAAARKLGMLNRGVIDAKLRVVEKQASQKVTKVN